MLLWGRGGLRNLLKSESGGADSPMHYVNTSAYPTPYCTLLKVHLQQVPCFGFCVSVVLPPVQAGPQSTSFHSMSFRYNVEDKTQELNSCYINEPMVKLVSL